jgi:hypothetical protein
MECKIVDFNLFPNKSLFTGPKNGSEYKRKLGGVCSERCNIKANFSQVITSSFFLGLLEDVLPLHRTKESALSNIFISTSNGVTKKELERTIYRYFKEKVFFNDTMKI